MKDKTAEAKEVLRECKDKDGFYASTKTYFGQYWVRDSILSLEGLKQERFVKLIARQLRIVKERQRISGEVPTAITIVSLSTLLSRIPLVSHTGHFAKAARILIFLALPFILFPFLLTLSLTKNRRYTSATNQSRYEIKPGFPPTLNGYHSDTGDSEILYVIGLQELSKKGYVSIADFQESINKAIAFIESQLDQRLGLRRGGGWEDAMRNCRNKFCLINNVLLWRMYDVLGWHEKAQRLRNTINTLFWDQERGYYVNFLGGDRFDTLAHALLLKWKIPPAQRFESIVEKLNSLLTPWGYRNIDPPYSLQECGQQPYSYQNGTHWPFIDAYVILALKQLGFDKEARRGFEAMSRLKGFNEWYCPFTGRPAGSQKQLWSAAGYLMVKDLF